MVEHRHPQAPGLVKVSRQSSAQDGSHPAEPSRRLLWISALGAGGLVAYAWLSGEINVGGFFGADRGRNLQRFLTQEAVPFPLRQSGFSWAGLWAWVSDHWSAGAGRATLTALWIADLGLCKLDELGDFIGGDTIGLGGKLPLNTSGGQLSEGRIHGIGLINASITHMGILTPQGPQPWHPAPPEVFAAGTRIRELCAERDLNIADVALRFAIDQPLTDSILLGVATEEQLASSLSVLDTENPPDLMQAIDASLGDEIDLRWHEGLPENFA